MSKHIRFALLEQTSKFRIVPNTYYEGEGAGEGGGEGAGEGGGEGGGSNGATKTKIEHKGVVPQEKVNQLLREEREKARKQHLAYLESLQEKGVSEENLASLTEQIQQLRDEGKTKEQLKNEELSKAQKTYEKELKKREAERDKYKNMYEGYRSKTEVLTAATAHKAINPEQIYNILLPNIYHTAALDADGKPTEEVIPRVKLSAIGEDGSPTVLDLTIPDAIKKMTEMGTHENLFASGVSAGLGSNNGRRTGGGSTAPPTNMDEYQKHRKQFQHRKGAQFR